VRDLREESPLSPQFMILISALAFCLSQAVLQLIPIVEVLFPAGSNPKADLLLNLKPIVYIAAAGFSLTHLYLLFRKSDWKLNLLGIYSIAILSSLVLLPGLAIISVFATGINSSRKFSLLDRDSEQNEKSLQNRSEHLLNLVQIQMMILVSSILLMALSSSFPKGLSSRESLYLISTASLLTTAAGLLIWSIFELFSRIASSIKDDRSKVLLSAILKGGIGAGFYFYLFEKTASLNLHADFFSFNLNIAALSLGVTILLVNINFESKSYHPRNLFRGWLDRRAAFKLLLFAGALKFMAISIKKLGHDLASEIVRDYFFVLLAVLIVGFASILATHMTSKFKIFKNTKVNICLALLFFLIYIPVMTGKDRTWVSEIENNRLFSRFLTQKSHKLLNLVGAGPNRTSMKYSRILSDLSLKSDPIANSKTIQSDTSFSLDKKPHVFFFVSDATTSV